jgi:hypothetical protein
VERIPLVRWLAIASALLCAELAALVVFWAGVFQLLRRLWPLLPVAWSGAIGLAVLLCAIASALVLYFVLLRLVMLRNGRMRREVATGRAVFVGALPLLVLIGLAGLVAAGIALMG